MAQGWLVWTFSLKKVIIPTDLWKGAYSLLFLQKSKNQYEEQLKRHPILLNSLVTIALLLAATGLAMLLFHFVQEDTPGIAML